MTKPGCCVSVQNAIFGNMERFFCKFGQVVAKFPIWFILGSLFFFGLCCIGFTLLENETDQNELWVPTDSDFYRNTKWTQETFPSTFRFNTFMMVTKDGGDILTKSNLDLMRSIIDYIDQNIT